MALAPELCLFTTSRLGGKSCGAFESLNLGENIGDDPRAVRENRSKVLSTLKISPDRIVSSNQSHGSRIAVVERGAKLKGFDGFATGKSGIATIVSTADCYPVILYSPPERALISLHVGRRGAKAGIIDNAVKLMKDVFKADLRYSIAAIGPGICYRCYSVSRGEGMEFPASARKMVDGSLHLDIKAFIIQSLVMRGLDNKNIIDSNLCTSCTPQLFYSYRRDRGCTGRHWTIALIDRPWGMRERLLDG